MRSFGLRVLGRLRGTRPRWGLEEHPFHLTGTDRAHELAEGAIDEEQHEKPELNGPEVRPDGLVQQSTVCPRRGRVSATRSGRDVPGSARPTPQTRRSAFSTARCSRPSGTARNIVMLLSSSLYCSSARVCLACPIRSSVRNAAARSRRVFFMSGTAALALPCAPPRPATAPIPNPCRTGRASTWRG